MGRSNPQPQFDRVVACTEAMAQAWISDAMRRSGVWPAELARRLGVNRSRIPQMLARDGMTMRTFARALAACGYEVRFEIRPVPPSAAKG